MFACDLAPLMKACGARQRGCVCQDPFPLPGRVAESGSTHLVCVDGMNELSRKKEENCSSVFLMLASVFLVAETLCGCLSEML